MLVIEPLIASSKGSGVSEEGALAGWWAVGLDDCVVTSARRCVDFEGFD